MTTSSLVCVADAGAFEAVVPSAVNSGTTFTATFRKAHASGAIVSWGGLCGTYVAMTKDVWNTTGAYGYTTVTAPLRQVWPVIGSTSATSAQVWISIGANYDSYAGQATTSSEAYTLYPGAETVGVATSGTVDNTFALAPNNVAWGSGDSVEQPQGAAQHVWLGNWQLAKYFPSQGVAGGGAGITYSGIWSGNDKFWFLTNNTNTSLYTGHGGTLNLPTFLYFQGASNYGMFLGTAPDRAALQVGCPVAGCGVNVMQSLASMQYSGGNETIQYNNTQGRWQFSSGKNAYTSYIFEDGSFHNTSGLTWGTSSQWFMNVNGSAYVHDLKSLTTITAGSAAVQITNNTGYLQDASVSGSPQVKASLSGTTGTITGTALSASCDSGTASVTGAVVGSPVAVSSTTGVDVGGAFNVRGSVTSAGTVTVYVCGTGTPASLAYNVRVIQ
jgi:hypothetical protein